MSFDTVLVVDWSGGRDRGPRPKKDAIWACLARGGQAEEPVYLRNRRLAEAWITDALDAERAAGRRVLAGFDFAFGYPQGFGRVLTGSDDPFAIWDWFATHLHDDGDANNRFDLAGRINAMFAGVGPFWGNALARDIPDLPRKGLARHGHGMPEKRAAETLAKGAFPVWQLSGAGAVGSQVFTGLPLLARLRARYDAAVWPFTPPEADICLAEVWPSLIATEIAATQPAGAIRDAHQVRVLAQALSGLAPDVLAAMLDVPVTPEGSILGLGHVDVLAQAALGPPALRNDCFALPQGTHWTAVPQALDHLQRHLVAVTGTEACAIGQAAGRFLAVDVVAGRSHPPRPNAAVDGYGFAGPVGDGPQQMPLVTGRAAAGQPFDGTVPAGHAVRILTGASLPDGVDTVIMQEDTAVADDVLRFHGPLRQGANARKAGEDMVAGDVILQAGRRLGPADIATATAAGVGAVRVHNRLRVGILSTGDELREAGADATPDQIYDANRPMLCAMAAAWGHAVVDLGRAPDDRQALRAILDDAAVRCDVIITSGGASAGDEDHMSALLRDSGGFALWRIAMKPGRPMALGLWQGRPVFGLPGNPVAAMVCALVFARPALGVLAGGNWTAPQGFAVPAGFAKTKKRGRREYLRARIREGRAHVFASEGSGRVSGLAWAEGLVMLDDGTERVAEGDPVQFLPFGSFGL